jgi:hypothetical protein
MRQCLLVAAELATICVLGIACGSTQPTKYAAMFACCGGLGDDLRVGYRLRLNPGQASLSGLSVCKQTPST